MGLLDTFQLTNESNSDKVNTSIPLPDTPILGPTTMADDQIHPSRFVSLRPLSISSLTLIMFIQLYRYSPNMILLFIPLIYMDLYMSVYTVPA